MKSRKLLLIGGMVLGLLFIGGGVFVWRQRKAAEVVGLPDVPEQKSRGPLVTPPPAEEMTYEPFTTADGNLSFEYPQAWVRTEIKNLETVLPKNFIDKYELAMPLILSDPRGAQATLSAYQFEKGITLDAAMESFRADLVAMGQPYNEVSRQMVGDVLVVDSTVDAGQGVTVKVRDILFLVPGPDKDAIYDICFNARQENWGDYQSIFDHVQTSAKLSL